MASELLDDESQNFVRLYMLIAEQGTKVFRKTLELLSTTKCRVTTFKEVLDYAEPYKKKVNPSFLQKQLWPAIDPPEFVNQLDMTACNGLLHLTEISDLTSGHCDPLKDALGTIKEFRNQLCHQSTMKVPNSDFEKNFDDIKQAFRDIGTVYPTLNIPGDEIERYGTITITKEGYREVLQEVSHVKQDIDKLKQDTTSTIQYMAVLKQDSAIQKHDVGILKEISATQKQEVSRLKHETTTQKEDLAVLKQESVKQKQDIVDIKQKVFPVPEGIPDDYCSKINGVLRTKYLEEMSFMQFNPVDARAKTPMSQLYVSLSIVKMDFDKDVSKGIQTQSIPLEHYTDIFKQNPFTSEKSVLRVMVMGKAGVGKTTLSRKIANDWAAGHETTLKKFENVFLLSLRDVEPKLNLCEAIADQLLPYKDPYFTNHLEQYIKENGNKCLFIFDGLDEMKRGTSKEIEKMIESDYLPHVYVFITSRPSQVYDHFRSQKKVDFYAEIGGFDEETIEKFIHNFFSDRGQPEKGKMFFELICDRNLLEIGSIPIVLNMLCKLFAEEGTLANTKCSIYKELREFLCKRQRDLHTKSVFDEREIEDILLNLGRVAFECLLSDQIYFPVSAVDEKALELGLIAIDKDPNKMKKNTWCYFLHKSLQENVGAFYVARETEKGNLTPWKQTKGKIRTESDAEDQELFLYFCAGESKQLGNFILDHMDELLGNFGHKGRDVLLAMKKISQNISLLNEELVPIIRLVFDFIHIRRFYSDYERISKIKSNTVSDIESDFASHNVNQFYGLGLDEGITPTQCLAIPLDVKSFSKLVKMAQSVSWVHMDSNVNDDHTLVGRQYPIFLHHLLERNEYPLGVSVDMHVGTISHNYTINLLRLLRESPKVKYVFIKMRLVPVMFSHFPLEQKEWEEIFEILQWVPCLVGLDLSECAIPVSVARSLGRMLNLNSTSFLILDLSKNQTLYSHLGILNQEITNPLSLKVFSFNHCFMDSSDKIALIQLLKKCESLDVFNLEQCKSDMSSEILKLKNIRELNLSKERDRRKSELDDNRFLLKISKVQPIIWDFLLTLIERFNVGEVLENLDTFEKLEVLILERCGLEDHHILKVHFKHPSKLQKLVLSENNIGTKGLKHVIQHANMLQDLTDFHLQCNNLNDEAGMVLMDGIEGFPRLQRLYYGANCFSFEVEEKINEKCLQGRIEDDYDSNYDYESESDD